MPGASYQMLTGVNGTGANSLRGDGRRLGRRAADPKVDVGRLSSSMRACRQVLQYFREEKRKAVMQFVGRHWARDAAAKPVPINLLARYVQVVSRALVPKNPRVMFTTQQKANQPAVSIMQAWMNQRIVEMKFAETLQRWVTDALYGLAVMKVALATPADAAMEGYVAPAGVPFAECVSLDDFVYDLGARDFRQAGFVGHRFRIPLEVARSLDYYESAERKKLTADDASMMNQEGDEKTALLGQGWEAGADRDFEPMVELWEVYLPRTKRVVTLRSDAGGVPTSDAKPLRVQEWVGPDCGPYHFLPLQIVPDNAMSKGPIMDLIDLHDYVNVLYRKLINQAHRQKEVLPVSGGQVDDAKNLKQASDGEMFAVDNAAAIKAISYGGPNPTNAAFAQHLADKFSSQAGNLDLLSGANPQSKTASQDKMLNENASAGVSDMQERTVAATANVLTAFGWYWWNHPQQVMTTQAHAPGLPDVGIERRLYPRGVANEMGQKPGMTRDGRYEDLQCRVDPYSMQYRSPQQRLAFLSGLVKEMLPLMPLLQQQGIMFDMQFYLKKVAEYADEPDVTSLFSVQEPPPPQGPEGGGDSPSTSMRNMPAGDTTHEYTRRSEGNEQAGREADMENAARMESAAQDE